MMHFSPVSYFPLFSKNFQTVEDFLNFTFSRNISRFSSAKISDDLFLVIDHKFRISLLPPYFPCFSTFSPSCPKTIISPPTFTNFTTVLEKFTCFFTHFMCILFPPCFDHDAFMHHPMHILDAPDGNTIEFGYRLWPHPINEINVIYWETY